VSVTEPLALAALAAGSAPAPAASGPAGDIMPVVGYSAVWPILGALLVVVVALYYALSYLLTRPRPVRQPAAIPAPPVSVPQLQSQYLARVDEVADRFRRGELTPRRAHARLSLVVREFAAEASGVEADRMTLAQLRATRLVGTTNAVAEYYPQVFGVDDPRTIDHGVHAAREVIRRWR